MAKIDVKSQMPVGTKEPGMWIDEHFIYPNIEQIKASAHYKAQELYEASKRERAAKAGRQGSMTASGSITQNAKGHRLSDRDGEYAVGYKKPPEHGRFTKGQSGNPNGRPKRVDPPTEAPRKPAKTQEEAEARFFARTAKAKEKGREVELSVEEVLLYRMDKQSEAGSINATRELFARQEKARKREAERNEQSYAYWREYVQETEYCRNNGYMAPREISPWLPEPEDIIFRENGEVEIYGHIDIDSYMWARSIHEMRNFFLLKHLYDSENFPEPVAKDGRKMTSVALILAAATENQKIKRWARDREWSDVRMMELALRPNDLRDLLLKSIRDMGGADPSKCLNEPYLYVPFDEVTRHFDRVENRTMTRRQATLQIFKTLKVKGAESLLPDHWGLN